MEELIGRIVANVGIDAGVAEKSVGIILEFLVKEGPADKVQAMITAMPGADALVKAAEEAGAGGFFSMGGIMGLGSKLMGLGLGMSDIQGVSREVIGYAREKVGEETLSEIAAAIPGIGQFV